MPEICSFFKDETLTQDFSCDFSKIRKNTLFAEHHQTTASDCSSINSIINEELASETENYDTKTMYQFEPKCNVLRSTLQVKQQVSELVKKYTAGETTGFRSSRLYVIKTFVNSTEKLLCLSLLASNSIKKRLQCRYS